MRNKISFGKSPWVQRVCFTLNKIVVFNDYEMKAGQFYSEYFQNMKILYLKHILYKLLSENR